MPELDDTALERRLRGVLKEHLETLPLDLTGGDLDRRREAKAVARRSSRGRGMTLLAAAALLVGGALAAGSGLLRLPTVVPPVPEPSVVAVATPDATSPSPSESAAPSASPIPVAGPGGIWIQTGSMATPRRSGRAVRLLDGRVLKIGGLDGENDALTSAELYDPATGTWTVTGKFVNGDYTDAALLSDGKVLMAGPNGAQLYDPTSGAWTATGKMIGEKMIGDGRLYDAFRVLRDGRVLAIGGRNRPQLYDPASGAWTATGKMIGDGLLYDAFTVLRDGRVLAIGGNPTQLYDPASSTWTATGKMITHRSAPTATLLSDGRVLVAGGLVNDDPVDSAEVYDPVTGSWAETADMQTELAPRPFGMATQLSDGKVMVYSQLGSEVYDPTTGTWTALAKPSESLPDPAALLSDGTVLTVDCATYDPRTGSLTTASIMLGCDDARTASVTLLLDGTVLVAGGSACKNDGSGVCVPTGAVGLYVPAGVALPPFSFASPAPPVFPNPTPSPSPTPVPALLPPADGPVPPNARSWTITVENQSSEPATMFVAEGEAGAFRLVGSATPNVVPAGTTMKVTFLFPADGVPDDGWISVNPRLGEGADVGSVGADNIGMPGVIRITAECGGCWVGPASQ